VKRDMEFPWGYRQRMSERETGPVVLCQVAPILRAPP
jgi:hypothetical protein